MQVISFFMPGKTRGRCIIRPSKIANSSESLARSQRQACIFAMFIDNLSQPVLFSSAICASFCAWMSCTEPKARNGSPSRVSQCPISRIHWRRCLSVTISSSRSYFPLLRPSAAPASSKRCCESAVNRARTEANEGVNSSGVVS